MVIKLSEQQKAMLASYVRSAVGAGVAVYATGNHNVSDLLKAAVAALLPPLMRFVNPKDNAFGLGGSK
jgi:hypothetical protein